MCDVFGDDVLDTDGVELRLPLGPKAFEVLAYGCMT
jgi:hypothetical protein